MNRNIFTCYLLTVFIVVACNFSDTTLQLGDGWTYASESKDGKVIVRGSQIIPCKVVKYEFNDDFIIAMQKPKEECFIGPDSNQYLLGMDVTYYWIVAHKENVFLGPLNEVEYKLYRETYKIPKDLEVMLSD